MLVLLPKGGDLPLRDGQGFGPPATKSVCKASLARACSGSPPACLCRGGAVCIQRARPDPGPAAKGSWGPWKRGARSRSRSPCEPGEVAGRRPGARQGPQERWRSNSR